MSALQYRADIDGLRAVAILSVVLFHIDKNILPGGYIGVDVFFVISGFLITSIILKDLNAGTFSLSHFWERRVRRILPALITVIIACLVAGWFYLLPLDYENLGKQAFAQTIFSSNILFYLQSGYFDSANETKPLLHTWSLAVEEQFYIFFPFFMFLAWKFCQKHIQFLIAAIFIISLSFSVYMTGRHPSFAFYMLPTRAWELLIGAFLAFGFMRPQNHAASSIAGLSGIAMIAASCFLYTEKTPFPGIAAALPCFGAALVIWSGGHAGGVAQRILSCKPMVFIGKVSYSWYLWHWPVIVFYKYFSFDPLSAYEQAALFAISFVLGILSWKFIETPFRKRSTQKSLKTMSVACAILAGMATCALVIYGAKGYSSRFNQNVLTYADAANDKNEHQDECNRPSLELIKSGGLCTTNADAELRPQFILWGDSHADAIAPAFYALSEREGLNGYIATYDGCPPLLNIQQKNRDDDFYCDGFNKAVLSQIENRKIKYVFLAGSWTNWLNNERLYLNTYDGNKKNNAPHGANNMALESFYQTIKDLSVIGVKVYVIHTVPTAKFDPPRRLAVYAMKGAHENTKPYIDRASYKHARAAEEFLKSQIQDGNVAFIDPANILCNEDRCAVESAGKSLYYNGGHISRYGALYLSDVLRPAFHDIKSAGAT